MGCFSVTLMISAEFATGTLVAGLSFICCLVRSICDVEYTLVAREHTFHCAVLFSSHQISIVRPSSSLYFVASVVLFEGYGMRSSCCDGEFGFMEMFGRLPRASRHGLLGNVANQDQHVPTKKKQGVLRKTAT
jgi:hypothetical protein